MPSGRLSSSVTSRRRRLRQSDRASRGPTSPTAGADPIAATEERVAIPCGARMPSPWPPSPRRSPSALRRLPRDYPHLSGKLQLLFSDNLRERLLAPMALGDGRRNYRPRLQNPRIVVAVGILAPPLIDDCFFAALAPEMARWPVPEGV